MSSTKLVIIVLVLIGVLFVVFVSYGTLRSEPPRKVDNDAAESAPTPDWTASIKRLFGSLQPKLPLKKQVYSQGDPENIPPDKDHPLRTATFHTKTGDTRIVYDDRTPLTKDSPMKKLDHPQECKLPDFEKKKPNDCSIVALKNGGTLTITCLNNKPCEITVE